MNGKKHTAFKYFSEQLLNYKVYPISASLFIVLFLGVFHPFKINQATIDHILVSLMIIGTVHTLLLYGLRYLMKDRGIKNKGLKELLILLPLFFVIAVVTKSLHVAFGLSSFTVQNSLEWFYGSFMTLPLPHVITLVGFKKSVLRNYDDYTFEGISLDQIFYISALENYVELYYLDNGSKRKKIVRSTLSAIEGKLDFYFVRCHRSHILNTRQKIELSGNARSYKATMNANGETIEIPVSVNRYQDVLKLLNQ